MWNWIHTRYCTEGMHFFGLDNGVHCRPLGDQKFSAAPFEMAYDPVNRILYSASWEEVCWH